MSDYGYIYKTTNLKEGKVYIGQNKGEFKNHYYGSGRYLKSAIKKHGKESFKLEVVCYLPNKEQLDEFETFLILKYREILGRDKTYNITDGGEYRYGTHNVECKCCSCLNKRGEFIRTKEHNENIRKSRTGNPHPHPSNCKCPFCKNPNKGKPCSEETKKKISESQIGKKMSDEFKMKLRMSHLKHNPQCLCIGCVNRRKSNNVSKCV